MVRKHVFIALPFLLDSSLCRELYWKNSLHNPLGNLYALRVPSIFLQLWGQNLGARHIDTQRWSFPSYFYTLDLYFSQSEKFALRSQLDCFDSRLPGTGVFDIKTRAVTAIRHDILNFEENSGYQILTPEGLIESFEKEYYDLIRSAFLKYR